MQATTHKTTFLWLPGSIYCFLYTVYKFYTLLLWQHTKPSNISPHVCLILKLIDYFPSNLKQCDLSTLKDCLTVTSAKFIHNTKIIINKMLRLLVLKIVAYTPVREQSFNMPGRFTKI